MRQQQTILLEFAGRRIRLHGGKVVVEDNVLV